MSSVFWPELISIKKSVEHTRWFLGSDSPIVGKSHIHALTISMTICSIPGNLNLSSLLRSSNLDRTVTDVPSARVNARSPDRMEFMFVILPFHRVFSILNVIKFYQQWIVPSGKGLGPLRHVVIGSIRSCV